MKKWFSILFTLLLTASMLSGCGGNNSATDSDDTTASGEKAVGSNSSEVTGDIMIYTSAEDAFISEVCDMFNKRYPKANAQYYRSGTEEVISKIMAEKMTNSLRADLIMVSDAPTFESLKANDLLQPYDSPEIDNIYTEFVDPEHYYYGTFHGHCLQHQFGDGGSHQLAGSAERECQGQYSHAQSPLFRYRCQRADGANSHRGIRLGLLSGAV